MFELNAASSFPVGLSLTVPSEIHGDSYRLILSYFPLRLAFSHLLFTVCGSSHVLVKSLPALIYSFEGFYFGVDESRVYDIL